jgi:hypothetical protein
MSNKKQTAVEWLVFQLNKQGFAKVVTDEEIEQAKAMEKEQIVNAWISTDNELQRISAEQYYKETYEH